MGNYICLCNLQLVRGQQVCLAYSTHRKTPTRNILYYEDQVAPLAFTHIPEKQRFSTNHQLEKKRANSPRLHLQKNPEQLQ